jgi:thioredoxin 1
MSDLPQVTDANFETEVLGSTIPVIVDFWAAWCPPCVAMGPIFERVAAKFEGKVRFVKMDVQSNPEAPSNLGVMAIPTVIAFKKGEAADRLTGLTDEMTLTNFASGLLQG